MPRLRTNRWLVVTSEPKAVDGVPHDANGEVNEHRIYECRRKNCTAWDANVTDCVTGS